MREMQSPQGGYYASLDADSEHEEGKFYVWQRNEIRDLLSAEEYALVKPLLRPGQHAQLRESRLEPARDAAVEPRSRNS